MSSTAGLELETLLRFLSALVAVLALIGFAGWVLRRLVASGVLPSSLLATGAGSPRRLSVVEVRSLDVRRRLVLVRRDNVEHLLLLGVAADLVIETGIVPPFADVDSSSREASSRELSP
ncbi:MAG: flagellar biosynthetic protein FliO [Rhodospirillaceae bacterium]